MLESTLKKLEHAFLVARKDIARLEKQYKKSKDFKVYLKLQSAKELKDKLANQLNTIYDKQ